MINNLDLNDKCYYTYSLIEIIYLKVSYLDVSSLQFK